MWHFKLRQSSLIGWPIASQLLVNWVHLRPQYCTVAPGNLLAGMQSCQDLHGWTVLYSPKPRTSFPTYHGFWLCNQPFFCHAALLCLIPFIATFVAARLVSAGACLHLQPGGARQCPATVTFYALFNVLFGFSSNTIIVRLPVSHLPAIVFLFSECGSRVGKFM